MRTLLGQGRGLEVLGLSDAASLGGAGRIGELRVGDCTHMLVIMLPSQAMPMYAEEPSQYLGSCFFLWSGYCRRICM